MLTAAESPAGTRDPELASAQQAVLDGQQRVDAALAAAESSLQAATSVCAAVVDTPAPASPTADTTPTPQVQGAGTSSGEATSSGTTTGGDSTTRGNGAAAGPSSNDVTACQQAIKDTLAAQTALADAQRSLAGSVHRARRPPRAARGRATGTFVTNGARAARARAARARAARARAARARADVAGADDPRTIGPDEPGTRR